jgi:hypothetical protein
MTEQLMEFLPAAVVDVVLQFFWDPRITGRIDFARLWGILCHDHEHISRMIAVPPLLATAPLDLRLLQVETLLAHLHSLPSMMLAHNFSVEPAIKICQILLDSGGHAESLEYQAFRRHRARGAADSSGM